MIEGAFPICDIDVSAFKKVLPLLKTLISKVSLSILSRVKLVADDNYSYIQATNLDATIEWELEVGKDIIVYEGGYNLINLYRFAKTITASMLKLSDVITLYRCEGGYIAWEIGDVVYQEDEKIDILEYPNLSPTPDTLEWKDVDIEAVISHCAYAAEQDSYGQSEFRSIAVTESGFVSTDGHRLALYRPYEFVWESDNVIIPCGKSYPFSLSTLKGYKFDRIAYQMGRIFVRSTSLNLTVRLDEVKGNYPDFTKLFYVPDHIVTIKRDVIEKIKSLCAKVKSGVGTIVIKGDKLYVRSDKKSNPNAVYTLEQSYASTLCLDVAYLLEAVEPLLKSGCDSIDIEIKDSDHPVQIQSNNYRTAVMPMMYED